MVTRKLVPAGLSVFTDLYRDHLIFGTLIAVALFAGGYVLH